MCGHAGQARPIFGNLFYNTDSRMGAPWYLKLGQRWAREYDARRACGVTNVFVDA